MIFFMPWVVTSFKLDPSISERFYFCPLLTSWKKLFWVLPRHFLTVTCTPILFEYFTLHISHTEQQKLKKAILGANPAMIYKKAVPISHPPAQHHSMGATASKSSGLNFFHCLTTSRELHILFISKPTSITSVTDAKKKVGVDAYISPSVWENWISTLNIFHRSWWHYITQGPDSPM